MKKKTSPSGESQRRHEVRELRADDLDNGFLETLGSLSDIEGLTHEEARRILATIKRAHLHHFLVAVTGDGRVIGTTTLVVERKFIHGGGLVGHIEDVAVRRGYQGGGVGGSLVKAAVQKAKELGCYKCILDCKDDLVEFYERQGFRRHDVGMRIDLKPKAPQRL
jgi:glucosamine-phosphate N-acetyltransferase